MATQVEQVAQAGGSPHRIFGAGPVPGLGIAGVAWAVVAYNVAMAALAPGVFGWGIDSLFALMACDLVSYGMVMVAVMRREFWSYAGGR